MIRELIRSDNESESDSQNTVVQRDRIKGILSNNKKSDDIIQKIDCEEDTSFVTEVSVNQLQKLSKLDCYSNCFEHKKVTGFMKRWSNRVSCYIRYVDSENSFYIDIEVVVVDEISNEITMDFCKTFRNAHKNTNFDPLAENHDKPHLSYSPI